MTNSKHVPKRRFKEFESDGEWEQKILSELAEVEGGGTPSTVNPQYWDGDIDWYTPAEIGESVFVDQSKRKITVMGLDKSSAKMLPIGTVLFTSRAGIGKTAILTREGCTNQGFQSIVPKEDLLASYFIYSQSNKLKQYGERIGSGSTFVEVSGKQMSEMPLIIPSIFEQKKLGNFFQTIDSLISIHQHKLDKLKDMKQAYLTEMFPVEGERVPKRRFPGFEGEWEWKKLGELATIVRGASPRPIQDPKWFDSESEVGWLRISDVTEQNGRIYKLSQRLSSLGQEKTRVVSEPHLILSIAATVGKPVINYVRTGIHDGFLIFQEPKFEIEYMYYLLGMFRKNWASYGQPGSQLNLNSDIVKEQRVAIPSQSEQVEISKFFNKLDQSISLQQQKLDKLNDLKKAYLNELFV